VTIGQIEEQVVHQLLAQLELVLNHLDVKAVELQLVGGKRVSLAAEDAPDLRVHREGDLLLQLLENLLVLLVQNQQSFLLDLLPLAAGEGEVIANGHLG